MRTQVQPDLRWVLRDERPEVCFWAAYALGSYASSEGIEDLEVLAGWDVADVPGQGSVREEVLEAIDSIRQRNLGTHLRS